MESCRIVGVLKSVVEGFADSAGADIPLSWRLKTSAMLEAWDRLCRWWSEGLPLSVYKLR